MAAATRPEMASVLGMSMQARMALADLRQLVLGVDEVEHGGAFLFDGW
jgi:hypothetical protein